MSESTKAELDHWKGGYNEAQDVIREQSATIKELVEVLQEVDDVIGLFLLA